MYFIIENRVAQIFTDSCILSLLMARICSVLDRYSYYMLGNAQRTLIPVRNSNDTPDFVKILEIRLKK